jgi:CheY-like chemotaxis protein
MTRFNQSSPITSNPSIDKCTVFANFTLTYCQFLTHHLKSHHLIVSALFTIFIISVFSILFYYAQLSSQRLRYSPLSSVPRNLIQECHPESTSTQRHRIHPPSRADSSAKLLSRRLLNRSSIEEDKEKKLGIGFIEFSPRSTDALANLHVSPRRSSTLLTTKIPKVFTTLKDLNVLIVDDSETHRRILGRMLERLFCTHVDIEDGEDVFVALVNAEPKIDFILLDVQMPHSNGIVVCQTLRNSKITLPVGCITSYFSVKEREKYESAGFSFVLAKPFTQQVLAKAMLRALSLFGETSVEGNASNDEQFEDTDESSVTAATQI